MIARVQSGGQTGVDIAALRAAKYLGIPTGGTMPKGWRTLDGPRPEYATLYGMTQSHSADYAPRTFVNAGSAGATLRIAYDWHSAGEKCTLRAVAAVNQEPFDIGLSDYMLASPEWVTRAVAWIRSRGPGLILNVAGNSERTAPGIEHAAELILRDIFARCLAAEPEHGR